MDGQRPTDGTRSVAAANQRRFDVPESLPEISVSKVRVTDIAALIEQTNVKPIIIWIAIVLTVGMLYIASALFIPLVIATLASLSLRPIVAKLCKLGLPQSVASGLLIFAIFGVVAIMAGALYSPAQQWIAVAPQSIAKVQNKLTTIMKPLTLLDRAEKSFDDASGGDRSKQSVEVSVQKPGFVDQSALISSTGQLVAFIAAIAVLTFFMLSSGDDLLNRMWAPHWYSWLLRALRIRSFTLC